MRKPGNLLLVATIVAATLVLAGCALVKGPMRDPTTHYVLDTTDYEPVTSTQGGEPVVVGLDRVRVARYLDSPGIAVRQHGHTVNYSKAHRWAEPLESSISRILTENLTREELVRQVVVFPAQQRSLPDFDLQVSVSRAEAVIPLTDTPHAVFRATWELRAGREAALIASGSVQQDRLPWDGENYDQLAASISTGVAELTRQIAEALAASR